MQWLTGTHESDGVRYFNQESHEELLWWIQVPALAAATPPEQRVAARETAAAVRLASQAAKDAGYRLDFMLDAQPRSGRVAEKVDTANAFSSPSARVRKTSKAGATKVSSQVKEKAKLSSPQDGAGADPSSEKGSNSKAKKSTKKSTPSKPKS